MSVKNNCIKLCAELRRKGFSETVDTTKDEMINAIKTMEWSKITQLRYIGRTGFLVEYGYLKYVDDGEYRLTGADIDA